MEDVNSWKRLNAALAFYGELGYEYKNVPWAVSLETLMLTCPEERFATKSDAGALVGSAEQGFLHLDARGELEPGQYMALTPCFRNEPVVDDLHQLYFMKVELYDNKDLSEFNVSTILVRCHDFFSEIVREELGSSFINQLQMVLTHQGWDIELGGIEVGSYGRRHTPNLNWICATGLAEPRMSRALDRLKAL